MTSEVLNQWLGNHPILIQSLKMVGVLLASFISFFITKHYIVKGVAKITRKTQTTLDDLFFSDVILKRVAYIAPFIVIYSFAYVFPVSDMMIRKISAISITILVLMIVGPFINSLHDIYLSLEVSKGRPIKGYIQVVKLVFYLLCGIVIISTLMNKSPLVLLSGLGAMTAVLLLIFRDTILSLLASLQITSNDLVRVGDWIEVPGCKADGDVVDIALHTVKIQNFDKTYTIIPTHKLIDMTFKNWRGMKQSGGRRIKRSILIDMTSIRFCDEKMLERFKNMALLSGYIEKKQTEIAQFNTENNIDISNPVNGRQLTNIGTLRAYISEYLKTQKRISSTMTFLVRQLQPGPHGLPIEIYVFADEIAWAIYEGIQGDIFDHILSVLPEFDLKVYQYPGSVWGENH